MKTIELTRGQCALVDDEDYDWLTAVPDYRGRGRPPTGSWSVVQRGYTCYAQRGRTEDGVFYIDLMHRVILGLTRGDGLEADHINGNGLDNRRANLRLANHKDNARNRKIGRNNSSGAKGVCWDRTHQKWLARIVVDGRSLFLGRFDDIERAIDAYDVAAITRYGVFAKPNRMAR